VHQCVDGRIVEEGRDLLERKPEFPVQQHPVQTFDVGVGIAAVAHAAAGAGGHKGDLVVVMQRSHTHPDERGDLAHRASGFPVVHVHHRAG